MGVEKVRKGDTARTFEFLFRFNRVWINSRLLLLLLSLKLNGKVYDSCVQRVLVYGIKTWAMNAEDLNRLRRAERMMVRRMCM